MSRRATRQTLMLAAMLIFFSVLSTGCSSRGPQGEAGEQPVRSEQKDPPENARPVAGNLAPELIGTDVVTGEEIRLSALKGQVVMLNFWATWCPPCKVEMPAMQEFHEEMKGQVRILAVGADPIERPKQLKQFAEEMDLTFTILFDEGAGALTYETIGIPTSVFIDQTGRIRARHTGQLSLDQIRDLAAKTAEFGRRQ